MSLENSLDGIVKSFSPWGTLRRICVGTILVGFLTGIGLRSLYDPFNNKTTEQKYHSNLLHETKKSKTKNYLDYPMQKKINETCFAPNTKIEVYKNKLFKDDQEKYSHTVTVRNKVKNDDLPCIRPADNGYDLNLIITAVIKKINYQEDNVNESEPLFENKSESSFENKSKPQFENKSKPQFENKSETVGFNEKDNYSENNLPSLPAARLKILSLIPEVITNHFKIEKIILNSKEIPLQYLKEDQIKVEEIKDFCAETILYLKDDVCDLRQLRSYQYLDLAELVQDNLLSKDDFENQNLNLNISSKIILNPSLDFKTKFENLADLNNLEAYQKYPFYGLYTQETDFYSKTIPEIQQIVNDFKGNKNNVLDLIAYALNTTDSKLDYYFDKKSTKLFLPEEVLESGKGACSDYSNIFISILRGFGVPARGVIGKVVDNNGETEVGKHKWAEVLVPFKDGSYRWILAEPTWADTDVKTGFDQISKLERYVGYPSTEHLYNVDVRIIPEFEEDLFFDFYQKEEWTSSMRKIKIPPIEINLDLKNSKLK